MPEPAAPSESVRTALNYTVITQSVEEVLDLRNAPALSIAAFLVESGQMGLLPTISIYSERGADRKVIRILYMNAPALRLWKEMGRHPTEAGSQFRPAKTALLIYGMPFSE